MKISATLWTILSIILVCPVALTIPLTVNPAYNAIPQISYHKRSSSISAASSSSSLLSSRDVTQFLGAGTRTKLKWHIIFKALTVVAETWTSYHTDQSNLASSLVLENTVWKANGNAGAPQISFAADYGDFTLFFGSINNISWNDLASLAKSLMGTVGEELQGMWAVSSVFYVISMGRRVFANDSTSKFLMPDEVSCQEC